MIGALVQNLEDLEGKEVSLNLLSRLVLSSAEGATKYVEAGGLAPALLQRCAPFLAQDRFVTSSRWKVCRLWRRWTDCKL